MVSGLLAVHAGIPGFLYSGWLRRRGPLGLIRCLVLEGYTCAGVVFFVVSLLRHAQSLRLAAAFLVSTAVLEFGCACAASACRQLCRDMHLGFRLKFLVAITSPYQLLQLAGSLCVFCILLRVAGP